MPLINALATRTQEPQAWREDGDGEGGAPEALAGGEAAEGRKAARGAVQAGDIATVLAGLVTATDPSVREAILTGIARSEGPDLAAPLLGLLRTEDVALRGAVIETLKTVADDLLPAIEGLLDDPDPDVRIFSVDILHSAHSPRVPDIALGVALRDENVNVCAAAVDVLSELGRPDMALSLISLAARFPDQPFLAFAIRAALKRIG